MEKFICLFPATLPTIFSITFKGQHFKSRLSPKLTHTKNTFGSKSNIPTYLPINFFFLQVAGNKAVIILRSFLLNTFCPDEGHKAQNLGS